MAKKCENSTVDKSKGVMVGQEFGLVVDIVKNHTIEKETLIPFDEIVQDDFGLFSLESSSFHVPWDGNFTFTETHFRCKTPTKERDYFLEVHGKRTEILNATTVSLRRNDIVSFTRGTHEGLTVTCNVTVPCRLAINFDLP